MSSPPDSGSLRSPRLDRSAAVLGVIIERGPTHRAEIARQVGVSKATVTSITRGLIDKGVLTESLESASASEGVDGRAGGLLRFSEIAALAGGVNLTLDSVAAHVCDLAGARIGAATMAIAPEAGWRERADAAVTSLDLALQAGGIERTRLLGIGFGVPGRLSPKRGVVRGALAEQPWNGVDVAQEMTERFGRPVIADNNVRLETLAERRWGSAANAQNMLYVNVSSGVGLGVVASGELYRGADGDAGEFGHVSIDIDGPACPCGNRGCLVLHVGGPALQRRLASVLSESASIAEIIDAADDGNRAVRNVLAEAGRIVGKALASVCNLLGPDLVVVGGQTASAGSVFFEPLKEGLLAHSLSSSRRPRVIPAELGYGAEVGARGGASLVIDSVIDSPVITRRLIELSARKVR